MTATVPVIVAHVLLKLRQSGFSAELVGGAVRDLLLGKSSQDWDLTTNATPDEILPLFNDAFYENSYGTVMVALEHLSTQFSVPLEEGRGDEIIDITTYRADGEYRNHRAPETVTWGTTIDDDLMRRDFTINAIALRPTLSSLQSAIDNSENGLVTIELDLIDPYGGQADLSAKIIRTVGDPTTRFREDALRLLRAVRFANQFQFAIDAATLSALTMHADDLSHVSSERIADEFLKMLSSATPDRAIILLERLGLLPHIVPELLDTKGVRQSGHHIYDVWEHSVRALGACPSTDVVVRLATLLHDIGKPSTYQENPDGTVTFYNHEVVGARIAKSIAMRLRLPKHDCDRIFTLVRWHMFTYESFVTDAYIRRFLRRVGVENMPAMMDLRTADRVGSGSKATSWRLEELKERIDAELHQPLKITDLAIDGHDLIESLGLQPGPLFSKILTECLDDVLESPDHNTREYLLKKAQSLATSH